MVALPARIIRFLYVITIIVLFCLIVYFLKQPEPNLGIDIVFGGASEIGGRDGEKSKDLKNDLGLMWETKLLKEGRASTDRAIEAANRVFNTVDLVGANFTEVRDILGDHRTSNDSMYNFSFFEPLPLSWVYRFDTGNYGWQFDVVFGNDGCVSEVRRQWIH